MRMSHAKWNVLSVVNAEVINVFKAVKARKIYQTDTQVAFDNALINTDDYFS